MLEVPSNSIKENDKEKLKLLDGILYARNDIQSNINSVELNLTEQCNKLEERVIENSNDVIKAIRQGSEAALININTRCLELHKDVLEVKEYVAIEVADLKNQMNDVKQMILELKQQVMNLSQAHQ
ncbi:MAG: hypothetical protein IJ848_03360 [Alphaproteobacteria bacterium]|nr:hypothetical protein [Alphaproteobacteria bacterium]